MFTQVDYIETSRQRIDEECPNCGGREMDSFYDAGQVPSHSCLLMASVEEALRFPTGRLSLAYCVSCGFIGNVRYDARHSAYSPEYEETQHFSSCFSEFARRLAQRWVDRYDLHKKLVLEIGCGKGEFLALLCELGPNRGIGVDPSCVPERLGVEANSRIRFIREYYSEKFGALDADVILCRHTLEHIAPTRNFIRTLRTSLGDAKDTLVLFELPDITRILREGAFWDLYYEHCSNFTAGTLARLFRSNGFDVVELERDFDDQYLLLAARPADGPTEMRFALEEDLEQTSRDVDAFCQNGPATIEKWRNRLCEWRRDGKRIVVWGSGSKCVAFFTTLGVKEEVERIVDINPYRQGKFLPGTGHPIVSPEALTAAPPEVVVVMNPIYCEEIREKLLSIGLTPELVAV